MIEKSVFRKTYESAVDAINIMHDITNAIYIEEDLKERQRLVKELRAVCNHVKSLHIELCAGEEG